MNWILIPVAIALYELTKKHVPAEAVQQNPFASAFPISQMPDAAIEPSAVPPEVMYEQGGQNGGGQ